jgi:hypothetical protein
MLAIIAVFTTATNSALADSRHNNRGPAFKSSFNPSYNRSFNRSFNRSYNSGYNSRYNTQYNYGFDRNFTRAGFNNNNRFRYYNTGNRYRQDNWSVSLNLGSAWVGSSVYSGFGSQYYGATVLGNPYIPYRNRTTVIYSQPSVVYVNDSPRVTGHVSEYASEYVSRNVSAIPSRNLLRDIHGDCYERSYDDRGRETRIQLPTSACNF